MSKEELVEKTDKNLKIQECKDEIKKYFLERLDAETDENSSCVFVEKKVYNIMSSQEVADIIEKHGCTRDDISIYSNYYDDLAIKKFEAIKRDGEFKEVGKTTTIDIPAFLDEVEKNVRKYVHDNIGSATNDRDFIYLLINLYSLRYINPYLLKYVSQYLYDSKPHEKVLPYMVYVATMQERCKDLYEEDALKKEVPLASVVTNKVMLFYKGLTACQTISTIKKRLPDVITKMEDNEIDMLIMLINQSLKSNPSDKNTWIILNGDEENLLINKQIDRMKVLFDGIAINEIDCQADSFFVRTKKLGDDFFDYINNLNLNSKLKKAISHKEN